MKPAPWDSIFAEKEHAWLDPDPWVSSFLSRFAQGARLLDVGCGCGRHLRRAFLSACATAEALGSSVCGMRMIISVIPAFASPALLLKGVSEPRRRREPRRPVSRPERRPFKRRGVLFYALIFPHRQLRIHHAHGLERDSDDDQ